MTTHTLSRCLMTFVAITILALFSSASQATLIGDTITGTGTVFAIPGGGPTNAVVGAGPEFTGILVSVDVGASSVRADLTVGSNQNFGGTQTVVLSDLDWVDAPGIVVGTDNLNVQSATLNFNVIGTTDDSVTFTFQGTWAPGDFAEFDLVTEHQAVVPEPSALLLATLGMVGLVGRRRRRR